jgi:uncharacterized protein
MTTTKIGTVGWQDLTVPNAEALRDFYKAVIGWESSPVDLGGYSDFNMISPGTDQPAAGICHARGGSVRCTNRSTLAVRHIHGWPSPR